MNSFLWPLVEELLRLAVGVPAFDISDSEHGRSFILCAYLIVGAGNIPAIAILICIKGHNGKRPCRLCSILALRVPGSRSTTHYVPLDRRSHPDLLLNTQAISYYDAASLPMRSALSFALDGHAAQFAATNAETERLSKESGIKGISILSYVPSLSLPDSFPYDFMHLIYENVLKILFLFWTDKYKDLGVGVGSFVIPSDVWKEIGKTMAAAGDTIPGAFGARPPNFVESSQEMTADAWSFWLLYLGPILLEGRFASPIYYSHFILLSEIAELCIRFVLERQQIEVIRQKCLTWVKKYEDGLRLNEHSQYDIEVDRHARRVNTLPEMVIDVRYGQLRHILVLTLPPSPQLGLSSESTHILAGILPCKILRRNARNMAVYKQTSTYVVEDVSAVQCLIGRVLDRGHWTIIDRSSAVQRAYYAVPPIE
ncbi:hypothetical protein FISHEDRAFT_42252 [Fistulina hepatica ATCC 64428]|uniref:Uncharacterized protein n=1 Tax=Fistulina hepatica ATCC 64428 TaxID=1128425 RepID=A0A0D7AGI8_9AGAR|nr:hypothetical protein FISHEDRAFT_42252 [Fistulina hepatica ATCC 64428]